MFSNRVSINNLILTAASLLAIFLSAASQAHTLGHGDNSSLRTWTTNDNIKIQASLLVIEKNKVILEDMNGKRIGLDVSELSEQDQSYAKKRMSQIAELNRKLIEAAPQENSTKTFLFFVAGLMFLSMTLDLRKKKFKVAAVSATLASSSLLFTSCNSLKSSYPILTIGNSANAASSTATGSCAPVGTSNVASVFSPFLGTSATASDSNFYFVSSNGIPTHQMMVGIKSGAWQQQVPIMQPYNGANAWPIPRKPTPAANPISAKTSLYRGAIAIAANGVPIFNALDNVGRDAQQIGELDSFGGHSGKADDYHYHIAPLHLQTKAGQNNPIAVALDGYMIYGQTEPDGSALRALDSFNGHSDCNGGYHYHGTTTYPYVNGGMHGVVATSTAGGGSNTSPQIVPQALSIPTRGGGLGPLDGALITNFTAPTANSYELTYTLNGATHKVSYSWSGSNNWGSGNKLQVTFNYNGDANPDTPNGLSYSRSNFLFEQGSAVNSGGIFGPNNYGWIDGTNLDNNGYVSGWAAAYNDSETLYTYFYLDGPYGTGTYIGGQLASMNSPDLVSAGFPGNHRFAFALPQGLHGWHTLYAYALRSGYTPYLIAPLGVSFYEQ